MANNNNNLHGLWYIDAQLRLHSLDVPAQCVDTTGGLVTSQPCSMAAPQIFTGLGEWATDVKVTLTCCCKGTQVRA
jgi:hypothetical protein